MSATNCQTRHLATSAHGGRKLSPVCACVRGRVSAHVSFSPSVSSSTERYATGIWQRNVCAYDLIAKSALWAQAEGRRERERKRKRKGKEKGQVKLWQEWKNRKRSSRESNPGPQQTRPMLCHWATRTYSTSDITAPGQFVWNFIRSAPPPPPSQHRLKPASHGGPAVTRHGRHCASRTAWKNSCLWFFGFLLGHGIL